MQKQIGSAVFWAFKPFFNPADVRRAAVNQGMGTKYFPQFGKGAKTAILEAATATVKHYNKVARDLKRPILRTCIIPDITGEGLATVGIVEEGWDTTVSHAKYAETDFKCVARIVRSIKKSDRSAQIQTASPELKSLFEAEYQISLMRVKQHRMVDWITKFFMRRVNAVNLRPASGHDKKTLGGLYFVPRPYVEEWRLLSNVVEDANLGLCFEFPVYLNAQTKRAVLHALQHDAEQTNKLIEQHVYERFTSGYLLNRQLRAAQHNLARLSAYETYIQTPLDGLKADAQKTLDLVMRAVTKSTQEKIFP